eukprot:TRINITY_DN1153_c0_g1_i1.p1 TRINITY_DN1153_c0_g1~~TRINITY_DN1153_c0_g1_i1.p1  ORF type:complete len:372 (-),score=84.18 TRINITY_DN1153_c0_g1_i1:62-1177(-)
MEAQVGLEFYKRTMSGILCFKGSEHFRNRIIYATLAAKTIRIDDIRENDTNPGLRDYEANFLRLVEKVTNGCDISINDTGTRVMYRPGIIVCGDVTHDCGNQRSISWFLEGILGLAPFGKSPLNIVLNGITNDNTDVSVDLIRTVTLPTLRHFGIEEDLQLKISKRGAPPNGGGSVKFFCPSVRELKSIELLDEGKIRRIRGIAYSTRVSPQTGGRMVDAAKSVLNKYMQDVFIYTDHYKGSESGLSPGFGLSLVAESSTGNAMGCDGAAEGGSLPEELGVRVANALLNEVANRGCVDSSNQSLVLLLMILCPETISKVRLGKLTPYTMKSLRHLKDFFGVTFKIEPDPESMTIVCTCRGIGFKNLSKRVY